MNTHTHMHTQVVLPTGTQTENIFTVETTAQGIHTDLRPRLPANKLRIHQYSLIHKQQQ